MKWISIPIYKHGFVPIYKNGFVPIYKYHKYICDECTSKLYTIIRKGIHGNHMDINYIMDFCIRGSIGPTLFEW